MKSSEEKELKSHLRPGDLKTPFQVTRTDEARAEDRGRVITIRLNDDELAQLEAQKKYLNTNIDATALKFFWEIGWNVLPAQVKAEKMEWLTSRNRTRYDGRK